jgi:hypothetical protein
MLVSFYARKLVYFYMLRGFAICILGTKTGFGELTFVGN